MIKLNIKELLKSKIIKIITILFSLIIILLISPLIYSFIILIYPFEVTNSIKSCYILIIFIIDVIIAIPGIITIVEIAFENCYTNNTEITQK